MTYSVSVSYPEMLNGTTLFYHTGSGASPNAGTTLTAVGVDKVIVSGSSPEVTGTAYVPVTKSITLAAKPSPSDASWPSGKPTWTIDIQPIPLQLSDPSPGETAKIKPQSAGFYTLTAHCGTSKKSITIVAWEVWIYGASDQRITQPQATIVGKKVVLHAVTNPTIASAAWQWTLGENSIKNYTQTQSEGKVVKLSSDDLAKKDLLFYVTSGGSLTAKCAVTVGTQSQEASATYNVARPSATLTSTTTNLDPPIGVRLDVYMRFGDLIDARALGIRWNATVTTTAGEAGKFAFTQVVNTVRRRTTNAGVNLTLTSGGASVLDTDVHYANGVKTVAENASQSLGSDDSPCTSMQQQDTCSVDDSFQLYLMYKPDGDDTIWVTLRRLDWYWKGSARGVVMDPGQSSSKDPVGSDTSALPEWSGNVTLLQWK